MSKSGPADFEDEPIETARPTAQPLGVGLGTHSAVALGGFQDVCMKNELRTAIRENGFEHPSEVQHQALPLAVMGCDVLAQAKSGMGKTAVFVFALLDQLVRPSEGTAPYCQAIVIVDARELAYQIEHDFRRFNKYLPHCTTGVFFGGIPEEEDVRRLQREVPAIVVGTPGRILSLINRKALDVSRVKHFIVDEFDRSLEEARMRRDVQAIFLHTPREKQVMMFSATMTNDLRDVALKFMNKSARQINVDQQSKLTLHGLTQYYCNVTEAEKGRRLVEILDVVEFKQCIIFVSSVNRCEALNQKLQTLKFPSMAMHSSIDQPQRLKIYDSCKTKQTRILVSTDLFGRGVDMNNINLVVQYDMAKDADTYLHRVGRAGRFGTKGITIAFLTDDVHEYTTRERAKVVYEDKKVMAEVQSRFEMHVKELTNVKEQVTASQYQQLSAA